MGVARVGGTPKVVDLQALANYTGSWAIATFEVTDGDIENYGGAPGFQTCSRAERARKTRPMIKPSSNREIIRNSFPGFQTAARVWSLSLLPNAVVDRTRRQVTSSNRRHLGVYQQGQGYRDEPCSHVPPLPEVSRV